LVVWAPAKLNLFLEILGKRTDGYHELRTLMVAVDLFDTLVVQEGPAGAIEFECDGARLPQGAANLVVRAAQVARREAGGRGRGVRIRLRKRIPVAAGLGGGSSDAAATLAALNRLWQLGLGRQELARLGAEMGSDVPFFFYLPAAVARGRGGLLEPLPWPAQLHIVLACPPWQLPTAKVYAALRLPRGREARPIEPLLAAIAARDWGALATSVFNRLAEPARRLCPQLQSLERLCCQAGLRGVSISGSGTSVFGLAPDRTAAVRAAHYIRERTTARTFVVRTLGVAQAA